MSNLPEHGTRGAHGEALSLQSRLAQVTTFPLATVSHYIYVIEMFVFNICPPSRKQTQLAEIWRSYRWGKPLSLFCFKSQHILTLPFSGRATLWRAAHNTTSGRAWRHKHHWAWRVAPRWASTWWGRATPVQGILSQHWVEEQRCPKQIQALPHHLWVSLKVGLHGLLDLRALWALSDPPLGPHHHHQAAGLRPPRLRCRPSCHQARRQVHQQRRGKTISWRIWSSFSTSTTENDWISKNLKESNPCIVNNLILCFWQFAKTC